MSDGITIRPFATTEEYHECVALQEDTWGIGFSERVAPAILKVAQILGGVSSGAYDADGRLVGFVFGLTGVRDGETVHWSDMLAVVPHLRDSGLGRRLKAYQREAVLEGGIRKMFWTFDPLQSRNAHLNITRLGAVVREYAPDMYGQTDSPLHRGIGTDRFIALWLLDSERVRSRVGTDPLTPFSARDGWTAPPPDESRDAGTVVAALRADTPGRWPRPLDAETGLEAGQELSVAIPSDLAGLMEDDLELAVAWRRATRKVFAHYLARGWEVRGFRRGDPVSTYLLGPIEDTHNDGPDGP